MSESGATMDASDTTVLLLVLLLVVLICSLIFVYKKLNRDTHGEYTVRNMVYKEGGVRDRVRGAALAVQTCVGVQLWPRSEASEHGEEMQEIQDEEQQVEGSGNQGSDTEGEEEQEEDSMLACGKAGNSSNNNSSLDVSEKGEEARLTDAPQANAEAEKKEEEKQEKVGEKQDEQEASGGAGLLIDLKQFSGSAIWSGEEGGEGKGDDVTAL